MSKTFRGGGYEVTVNADKSIVVKPGDWLSKYSMAMYGDFDHIGKFKQKIGMQYRDIPNPDLIKTGEILYHPDPLPGEVGISPINPNPQPVPESPEPGELDAGRFEAFLRWIKTRFLITDWTVERTSGGDLSWMFLSGQYAAMEVKQASTGKTQWLHAVAGGGTLGWPDSAFGGSFSTVDFPSAGKIIRSPIRHRLSMNDFVGGIIVFELGAGFIAGGAGSLVFFGMGFPPSRVLAALNEFLEGSGDLDTVIKLFGRAMPSGVAMLGGGYVGIPGGAVSGRVGYMSYF